MEIFKVRERYQQQFIDNANMQYDSICKIRLDIKNQLSADNYSRYYDFDMSKYYGSLGFSCALICLLACFNFISIYSFDRNQ